MKRHVFEAHFYATYFYANAVRNILHSPATYLRDLDEFFGDDRHLAHVPPFPRYSALHCFVNLVIDRCMESPLDIDLAARRKGAEMSAAAKSPYAIAPISLPVNHALAHHGIAHKSFDQWLGESGKSMDDAGDDDIWDYYGHLRDEGPLDTLIERSVAEVFFLLFQNRELLLQFNEMMATCVHDTHVDEVSDEVRVHFASSGVLRRVTIPAWVKRAVYFRDRGFCVLCHRDISGSTSLSNLAHYDHMVPLAAGGLNDVTNIQLLCETCNLQKSKRPGLTSRIYQSWYPSGTDDL